jgi:hypothetical protein
MAPNANAAMTANAMYNSRPRRRGRSTSASSSTTGSGVALMLETGPPSGADIGAESG